MWLDEIVCWDGDEYILRRAAIWRFVSRGLYPFIVSNGYALRGDVKEFTCSIATLLYRNRDQSCLTSPAYNVGLEDDDHKTHYYHVLSQTKWDELWATWSVWSDFTGLTGQDRQIDIQEYCWSQLNLDESSQTRVVEELLGNIDEAYDDMLVRDIEPDYRFS
jgi:hypothetical protein